MAFVSINELDKFIFDDCQIVEAKQKGDDLIFEVAALIVGARNSQNTNYTESYADDTVMTFHDAQIEAAIEEGYKVFDADDKLVSETPDKVIDAQDYQGMLKALESGFLFNIECISKTPERSTYSFEIDMSALSEDGISDPYATTYMLTVSFAEVEVSWERYLNRVQK